MKVRFTLRARADLEDIFAHLDQRAPAAARSVKAMIERQIAQLGDFPYMAPATDEPGIRELTMTRYPYKIYYEVEGDEVRILHIRDARRRRRRREPR